MPCAAGINVGEFYQKVADVSSRVPRIVTQNLEQKAKRKKDKSLTIEQSGACEKHTERLNSVGDAQIRR